MGSLIQFLGILFSGGFEWLSRQREQLNIVYFIFYIDGMKSLRSTDSKFLKVKSIAKTGKLVSDCPLP